MEINGVNPQKRFAAASAAESVKSGMVIGLGSRSTAEIVIRIIGEKVKHGLQIIGVPTSHESEDLARALGIPLSTLADHPELDLTIDGADEVELGSLDLIKGRGGALLREKIVASSSRQLIIVVDESKIVNHLGSHGRWAFAEFRDVYEMETDFEAKVEGEFNKMIESVTEKAAV